MIVIKTSLMVIDVLEGASVPHSAGRRTSQPGLGRSVKNVFQLSAACQSLETGDLLVSIENTLSTTTISAGIGPA